MCSRGSAVDVRRRARIVFAVPLLMPLSGGPPGAADPGHDAVGSASRQGRLRPPPFVVCDRDQLTVFPGTVSSLARGDRETTLKMATDENTTERFTVRHPGADATASFFIGGKPFTRADWATLLPGGTLRTGARATVWVRRDEPNPQVDWAPPAPGRP